MWQFAFCACDMCSNWASKYESFVFGRIFIDIEAPAYDLSYKSLQILHFYIKHFVLMLFGTRCTLKVLIFDRVYCSIRCTNLVWRLKFAKNILILIWSKRFYDLFDLSFKVTNLVLYAMPKNIYSFSWNCIIT